MADRSRSPWTRRSRCRLACRPARPGPRRSSSRPSGRRGPGARRRSAAVGKRRAAWRPGRDRRSRSAPALAAARASPTRPARRRHAAPCRHPNEREAGSDRAAARRIPRPHAGCGSRAADPALAGSTPGRRPAGRNGRASFRRRRELSSARADRRPRPGWFRTVHAFLDFLSRRETTVRSRYGFTAVVVGLISLLRLFVPLNTAPFLLYMPVVFVVGVAFGRGPGFLGLGDLDRLRDLLLLEHAAPRRAVARPGCWRSRNMW